MRQPFEEEEEMVQARWDGDGIAGPNTASLTADTVIQPKLKMGAPDDAYEREADAVADRVMRMADVNPPAPGGSGAASGQTIMRQPTEDREEEEIQAKRADGASVVGADATAAIGRLKGGGQPLPEPIRAFFEPRIGADFSQVRIHDGATADAASRASDMEQVAAPPIIHDVLQSPGQPLQPATRAFMETCFGHDFSQVRVHADAKASESARAENALAYTVGRNVVFGAGQYAPDTRKGKRLLAHELTHVAQQAKGPAVPTVQRKPKEGAETEDAESALGRQLWERFPAGVVVAFYQATNAEAKRRAKEYAKRENALAVSGRKITAESVTFGAAFSDNTHDVKSTLPALSIVLQAAANKAKTKDGPQPLAGTGPGKIRTLALFSHGTSNWCGVGSDITRRNAAGVIKKIAPALTEDVNVLLYACNVGRSPSEKQSWFKGTMEGGGEGSLGAKVRDELVEEGLTSSRVWGHTTTGHATRNWALRVFRGSTGKGSAGEAFAGEFVFGTVERVIAFNQVMSEITGKGYALPPDKKDKLEARAMRSITRLMYDCYREANRKLRYMGTHLAEMAPDHPLEVADIIEDYWDKTYWAGRLPKLAERLINRFNLKKSE